MIKQILNFNGFQHSAIAETDDFITDRRPHEHSLRARSLGKVFANFLHAFVGRYLIDGFSSNKVHSAIIGARRGESLERKAECPKVFAEYRKRNDLKHFTTVSRNLLEVIGNKRPPLLNLIVGQLHCLFQLADKNLTPLERCFKGLGQFRMQGIESIAIDTLDQTRPKSVRRPIDFKESLWT